MKAHATNTILILLTGMVPTFLSRAQTNPAAAMRSVQPWVGKPSVVPIKVATNAGPNLATVKFTLPKELSSYQVLEQRAHVTRAVTNLSATSRNEVQASLASGSLLMFVERPSAKASSDGSALGSNRLFRTHFLKAVPAAQPGREPDVASGELSMYADTDPTPWDSASNSYITHLSVVFTTDKPSPNHPLLPLTVGLSG